MDEITRILETAEEKYDKVVFNTDALFNEPAPEPVVAFIIGGVLSVMGIAMWLRRVSLLKQKMASRKPPLVLEGSTLLRAYISCAIDSDSPFYTIVSYGAVSFLFLGGIQLDYKWTLLAMIITYIVSAMGETLRILVAFRDTPSLASLVVTSDLLASKLRGVTTTLNPTNVYEDLGRGKTIVIMVFVTQCILISFVCVDIFDNSTNSCRDGSADCPIGGTLGSWGFYVLGIFMACVFQLGPKTRFGESEQNPAYWLQLLLCTKERGARASWYDPVTDKTHERALTSGDWRIWLRFIMSFCINGVGYHILVHALPIQVASQSSLTGVVFRAVGMMYLVDLDDTSGYKLTIMQEEKKPSLMEEATTKPEGAKEEKSNSEPAITGTATAGEISEEAQKIIEEAKLKLDALARGELPTKNKRTSQDLLVGVGALATTKDGDADKGILAGGKSGEDVEEGAAGEGDVAEA